MQLNNSSFMDTILGVLNLLNECETIQNNLSPVPRQFCKLLIKYIKLKFNYELNSNIYQVFLDYNTQN